MSVEPIKIGSLGEFIKAIKDITSGTALYRQVIRRFINKIEIESKKNQGKAWEYYSSIFLMREAQNIYFALVNFMDRLTPVEKKYLLGIYNRILDAIKKYCKNCNKYTIHKESK